MNKYRVDRADRAVTPVGMNSALYLGDSHSRAQCVFQTASLGLTAWNQPDPSHGVILSQWCQSRRDYVVIASRLP